MVYDCTRLVCLGSIKVSDETITRKAGEGFKALGVWITLDGHFTKEIAERVVAAWRRILCFETRALQQ